MRAVRISPTIKPRSGAPMPSTIHPIRRFPAQCSVTDPAGRFLNLLYCFGFWFLVTLPALSNEPAYAGWVFVSAEDEAGMTMYADPDTIRRNGNLVKMWHLSDRTTTEGYGSIKTQREYDCATARHRLLAASILSEHMGLGTILSDNVKEGQWIPVEPESSGQALWKFACGKK